MSSTAVPRRLVDMYGETGGVRSFPIPGGLPEVEVAMLWHVRLDADPAQR